MPMGKKAEDKWMLIDKKNRVVFSSDNATEVFQKGQNYPFGEVSIERRNKQGLCFFSYDSTQP